MHISEIFWLIAIWLLLSIAIFIVYIIATLAVCNECPYKEVCDSNNDDDYVPPCQRHHNFPPLHPINGKQLW